MGGKNKKGDEKPGKTMSRNERANEKIGDKGISAMEVRHILVEKRQESLRIMTVLNDGKMTFNEAARTWSIDKAGKSGLLGWRTRGELDPDFWDAAVLQDIGEHSEEPIKTVWGYHIVLVQAKK
jgi:parvulin-like peptidyl-prolyl isomerase